jgi:hypothetical protein
MPSICFEVGTWTQLENIFVEIVSAMEKNIANQ